MWAQDSVYSFLGDQVPWRVGRLVFHLQKGQERNGAPSSLLPPPSPVFVLLLSCSFGSDKLNLDCVKGELSLARLGVLLFLVLFHIPISNRSCVDFYKGQRNSVCSNH